MERVADGSTDGAAASSSTGDDGTRRRDAENAAMPDHTPRDLGEGRYSHDRDDVERVSGDSRASGRLGRHPEVNDYP